MSTPSRIPDVLLEDPVQPQSMVTLGWAVRRAALGIAILSVMVVLGTWLFYASIDVDEASASGSLPAATQSAPASR